MVKLLIAVFVLIIALEVPGAHALTFITHGAANSTDVSVDGVRRGIAHRGRRAFVVEVVHALRQELGYPGGTDNVPFARGWDQLQKCNDCVFYNVTKTGKRRDKAKWVGPLLETSSRFFKNANNDNQYRQWSDIGPEAQICVVRGNVHDDALTARGFENLRRVASYAACGRMLGRGRVDLTILSDSSRLLKLDSFKDKLKATGLEFSRSGGFIAFSQAVPDREIARWQAALDQMKADGRFDALYDQYFITDKP